MHDTAYRFAQFELQPDTRQLLAAVQALERTDWPSLVLRLRRAAEARRLGRRGVAARVLFLAVGALP